MSQSTAQPVPAQLNGRHRHTYEAIFRHPAAHNLEWHDVQSLLESLAVVEEGANGSLKVSRNGQTVNLHIPKHKDVATIDELLAIRHFLENSAEKAGEPPLPAGSHLLVVLDHHGAQIYRIELRDAIPHQLVPYDPHGFRRHLHSHGSEETDGHREPERKSFYESIAKSLLGAEQVLVFGSGTGRSSAMDQLLADLKAHHPEIAKRIVGAVVVDAHHTTGNELLAKAREFYAEHPTK